MRRKFRNRTIVAVIALVLFAALGTFYLRAHDPTFTSNFDAFYFVVVTMTTIGDDNN